MLKRRWTSFRQSDGHCLTRRRICCRPICNLFPLGLSVAVGLAPERSALASGRAVLMTSFAVLLAPLTVGTLADATSLTAAFAVVPVTLALAAAALTLVRRAQR